MSARFSKLNTRLAVVIGTILIVFLTLDILYSVKSSRDTAIHEVERWSVLLAETGREDLNAKLKTTKDAYERKDFESEIAEARSDIASAEKNIQELQRPIETDPK